jgi:hypothetical protein
LQGYSTGETNNGKHIIFGTGGADRMEITESGNVGIGTATPSEKLGVAPDTDVSAEIGRAHIGAVGHNDYAAFSHVDRNTTGNFALMQHSGGETYLNASSGTAINYRISNTHVMRMTSTGLGIGTNTPMTKLHVFDGDGSYPDDVNNHLVVESDSHSYIGLGGGTSSDVGIHFGDSGGIGRGRLAYLNGSDAMAFSTSGSERMRIDSSGQVGIGTSSPDNVLHVKHASTNVVAKFESGDNQVWINLNDDGGGTYGALLGHDSDAGDLFVIADNSVTKRVRVNSSGDINLVTGALQINGTSVIDTSRNIISDIFKGATHGTHSFLDFDDDNALLSQSNNVTLTSVSGMNFIIDTNNNSTNYFSWLQGNTASTSATQLMRLDESGNLLTTGGATIGDGSADVLNFTGVLKQGLSGGTTVMDASRNLLNLGNVLATGSFTTNGTHTDYGVLRVAQPGGADRYSRTATETGTIKIRLPQSFTSTMLRFTVKIYDYSSNEGFEVTCGGYTYGTSSQWINTFAYITGDPDADRNFTVRFGHDGTKCAVYIGETASSWTYPQITVTDFQAGFNNAQASKWEDGWDVTLESSFGTITATQTNNEITSQHRLVRVGGTTVIDTSRNLTNIGTISSSGTATINGELHIPSAIVHIGDTDTTAGFHGNDLFRIVTGGTERFEVSNSGIIINDGSADYDFRVESNGNANMLFVDGGNDRVGIGTSAPTQALHVEGNIHAASGFVNASQYKLNGTNVMDSSRNLSNIGTYSGSGDMHLTGVGTTLKFDTTGSSASNFIKTINDFETLIATNRGSAGHLVVGNSSIRMGFGSNYTTAQSDITINNDSTIDIAVPTTFAGNITSRLIKNSQADSTPLSTQFANTICGENSNRVIYFDSGGQSLVSTWYGNGNDAFGAIDVTSGFVDIWVNPANATWYNVADFSISGLNITTGGLSISGTSVINTARQLVNIDTITISGAASGGSVLKLENNSWIAVKDNGGTHRRTLGSSANQLFVGDIDASFTNTYFRGGSSNTYIQSNNTTAIEINNSQFVQFANNVKAASYFSGITSGVGVGGTPADANSAELGPGFLNLARDDTATAKQLVFAKNGAVHSYIETTASTFNIRADTVIQFLTAAGGSAQNVRTKSLFAGPTYGDVPPAGSVNATNTYELNGTTVIDASRNLTNIGTIASGHITATGQGFTPQLSAIDSDNTTGRCNIRHNGSTSDIRSQGTSGLGTVIIGGTTLNASPNYATFTNSGTTLGGTLSLSQQKKLNFGGLGFAQMNSSGNFELGDIDDDDREVKINGFAGTSQINMSDGTVAITGALSKSSGSFKIDHPLKPDTHHLVHSFVEGPQADNLYRGKIQLVNGKAEVDLEDKFNMTPGTFEALNRDIQIFTTNESNWDNVRGSVVGSKLIIESQNINSTAEVSWLVIGERQDKEIYESKLTDNDGRIIVEPQK